MTSTTAAATSSLVSSSASQTLRMMMRTLIWFLSQVFLLQGFLLQLWFSSVSDSDDEDSFSLGISGTGGTSFLVSSSASDSDEEEQEEEDLSLVSCLVTSDCDSGELCVFEIIMFRIYGPVSLYFMIKI